MANMGEGVVVLVIGMVIVFGVLILLWAILLGFEQVFYKIPKKRSEKAKAIESTPVEAPAAEAVATEEDELEIVAVITAAISAITGQNASKFKIKSIRRINK